jgi:hypothetical protein
MHLNFLHLLPLRLQLFFFFCFFSSYLTDSYFNSISSLTRPTYIYCIQLFHLLSFQLDSHTDRLAYLLHTTQGWLDPTVPSWCTVASQCIIYIHTSVYTCLITLHIFLILMSHNYNARNRNHLFDYFEALTSLLLMRYNAKVLDSFSVLSDNS